jgi:hypothetical protein
MLVSKLGQWRPPACGKRTFIKRAICRRFFRTTRAVWQNFGNPVSTTFCRSGLCHRGLVQSQPLRDGSCIATQALGDFVNDLLGRVIEGGVGVAVAGVLLRYPLRANVKAVFTLRK